MRCAEDAMLDERNASSGCELLVDDGIDARGVERSVSVIRSTGAMARPATKATGGSQRLLVFETALVSHGPERVSS
jgi:hypothetical protein